MKLGLSILASCLLLSGSLAQANDFPTLVRVEYVLGCMKAKGAENYDALYQCVCLIDTIAKHFSHQDYAAAVTFSMLRRTPGERGGVFRDPPQAKELVTKLKEVDEAAKAACLSSS